MVHRRWYGWSQIENLELLCVTVFSIVVRACSVGTSWIDSFWIYAIAMLSERRFLDMMVWREWKDLEELIISVVELFLGMILGIHTL